MINSNYSILNKLSYVNKPTSLKCADAFLTPLRRAIRKKSISHSTACLEKTKEIVLRVLWGLLILPSSPLLLTGLIIKVIHKKQETILIKKILSQTLPALTLTPAFQDTPEKLKAVLTKQLQNIRSLNKTLPPPKPGSWRAYGVKCGETPQSFESYVENRTPETSPFIVRILGEKFSEEEKKILSITLDYVNIFQNIPLQRHEQPLSMKELQTEALNDQLLKTGPIEEQWVIELFKEEFQNNFSRTKNGRVQYLGDTVLAMLPSLDRMEKENETLSSVAFTNEDLFSHQMQNFIFGLGQLARPGVGVWSIARFGNPSESEKAFKLALFRCMKIATHEIGHMFGLPHCPDFECDMGGYMNLEELDKRKLLFCAEDTAKLCYLTNCSLLDYTKNLLSFFETFYARYRISLDFSHEISLLKKRIKALEK